MKRTITTLIIGIYSIVGLNAQNNREELREQYRHDPDPYGWIDKETGWMNAVESFYCYVRINGLQLCKTVSENEFYQIMGGVNDSISEWGYFMYLDRSIAQQSIELSPIAINPAPLPAGTGVRFTAAIRCHCYFVRMGYMELSIKQRAGTFAVPALR